MFVDWLNVKFGNIQKMYFWKNKTNQGALYQFIAPCFDQSKSFDVMTHPGQLRVQEFLMLFTGNKGIR